MWLKLKIFFGYTILILLLVFIVYQFRQEQMLRHMLRKEEKKLVTIHRLAEKSYIGLLDRKHSINSPFHSKNVILLL